MEQDLQKASLDPENFKREGIDLECLPLEQVFEQLRTSGGWLSSEEAECRWKDFGPNKLDEEPNPLTWITDAAAVIAITLANGEGEGPDWQDFAGIVCLLLLNSTISFMEENNAGNAAAAFKACLAPKAKVLTDGQWQEVDAAILLLGDKTSIKLGDIIPADANILDGDPTKIDKLALTGESLPVNKKTGDEVFSGSTCKQGEIEAIVIATRVHSFFGKAAYLVDSTQVVGNFQKHCSYRRGINNLLGSHHLSQQGAITKRMTVIEEMAGMDVLCRDKTGTLTLNRTTIDQTLIEVFPKDMVREMVILLAARASRIENQDAIVAAVINMLSDSKEAHANIREVHFLPFNPIDKHTAITYIDAEGKWYRASKGAPEQILNLCQEKEEIRRKVHRINDEFAERSLHSLAVAFQEVPEKMKDSHRGPWTIYGFLPLFYPPRHDRAETICGALNLGGISWRLVMGTNFYPSSSFLGRDRDENEAIPVDVLIEVAVGFAGVFPEHKYDIVKIFEEKKHICGMTGEGVNDAPALKKADIAIEVSDTIDVARGAADLVLTEPGLSVIISAVLNSRAIFQRMKNYTIYAVSITFRIVVGFTLLALIWKYDFPPFMVLIIAILNDGTIMTISQDRVRPSSRPDTWKLDEIFATGIVKGAYLALINVLFYWIVTRTNFFEVATLIAVYVPSGFASISGIGWGWAGVIWLNTSIFYIPLDIIKFIARYALSGEAWNFL